MLGWVGKIEKLIKAALIVMMLVAIMAAAAELAYILATELMKPPFLLLNIEEMLEVFGFFLMILIGLKLLETVKAYFKEDKIHTDVVFLVAMIAISRKVIILDLNKYSHGTLLGIAAIILALAAGYYFSSVPSTNAPRPKTAAWRAYDILPFAMEPWFIFSGLHPSAGRHRPSFPLPQKPRAVVKKHTLTHPAPAW